MYQKKKVINYVQATEQDKDWKISIAFDNMEIIGNLDKSNYREFWWMKFEWSSLRKALKLGDKESIDNSLEK